MSIYGQVIRELREERDWTQDQLAEKVGLKKAAISAKERGANNVRPGEHKMFAEAFGITVQKFREHAADLQSITPRRYAGNRIPVINTVKAGISFDPVTTQLDEADIAKYMETVDRGGIEHPHAYAVKIHGDSMEPRIPSGAIAVCEPLLNSKDHARLHDGTLVVVCIEVEKGRTDQIGRFAWDGPRKFRLIKDNPIYEPQHYSFVGSTVQRIGIVVEVRFKP